MNIQYKLPYGFIDGVLTACEDLPYKIPYEFISVTHKITHRGHHYTVQIETIDKNGKRTMWGYKNDNFSRIYNRIYKYFKELGGENIYLKQKAS